MSKTRQKTDIVSLIKKIRGDAETLTGMDEYEAPDILTLCDEVEKLFSSPMQRATEASSTKNLEDANALLVEKNKKLGAIIEGLPDHQQIMFGGTFDSLRMAITSAKEEYANIKGG